jgi:hypothetical protein
LSAPAWESGPSASELVRLACRDNLRDANAFWDAAGFRHFRTVAGGKARGGKLLLRQAPALAPVQPMLVDITRYG